MIFIIWHHVFLSEHVSVVVSDASSVVSLKTLSVAPCGDLDKCCHKDTSQVNIGLSSNVTKMINTLT